MHADETPVLGALQLQVNSMSVCLSHPAELWLSAESKVLPCSGVDEKSTPKTTPHPLHGLNLAYTVNSSFFRHSFIIILFFPFFILSVNR